MYIWGENMDDNARYERNMGGISAEEQRRLGASRVSIIGCGALGQLVAEELARVGVGEILLADGDCFALHNLNRQIYAAEELVGTKKTAAAEMRLRQANSLVAVKAIPEFFCEDNWEEMIGDSQVVIDAVDNIPTRWLLERCCERKGLPLIHGAISGWWGQVATIFPGDELMRKIYPTETSADWTEPWGNLVFAAGTVASLQAAETVKILLNRKETLRNKLLMVDLLHREFDTIEIKEGQEGKP